MTPTFHRPCERSDLAWTALAGAAASAAVAYTALLLVVVPEATRGNSLALGTRAASGAAVALLAMAGAAAAWWAAKRRTAWRALQARRALLPLLGLPVAASLLDRELWRAPDAELLLILGAFGLALERALAAAVESRLLRRWVLPVRRLPPWVPLVVLVLCSALWAAKVAWGTTLQLERFASATSDLGEFDNLFFNALSGRPFRAPAIDGDVRDWSALKVHFELVLYALLPFYALAPGPKALLVLQAALVALTPLPLYLAFRRRLGRWAALAVAVSFLLLPAVQRGSFYDFHFPPVGAFFAACAVWTLGIPGRRGAIAAIVAVALALASREEISFGLAVYGAVMATRASSPRRYVALAVAGLAWFLLVKFAIMPLFGRAWFTVMYQDLIPPGARGLGGVVLSALTNPTFVLRKVLTFEKLVYLLHFAVPLAFVWVRGGRSVVIAASAVPFTLLVTNRPFLYQPSFQYVFFWAPWVVVGAAIVLGAMRPSARAAAAAAMLVVAALSTRQLGMVLGGDEIVGGFGPKRLKIEPGEAEHVAAVRRLAARIPPGASVAATEREGPYVSTRADFFSVKAAFGDPEYVVVGPIVIDQEKPKLRDALRLGWGVEAIEGPFALLRRGASPERNGELVRRLR